MPGTKRKRNGDSWRLEVTIGTDFTGKPNRYSKTVHCQSEREADRELAKFYVECEQGKFNRRSIHTVDVIADLWYEEHASRHFKTSTVKGMRTSINAWIKPLLGKKKISKLSRIDIQQWINHMTDKELSPKTVRNHYSVLCSIMKYAIDMDLLDDTPCKNIRLPKPVHHKAKYLELDDMKRMLVCLDQVGDDDLVYKVAILILLFGGLRKGEVLGLNWEDVDFDTCTVYVHRTRMIERGVGVYEDTPKTESSIRTVSLPAEIIHEMKKLQDQQGQMRELFGNQYVESPAILRKASGEVLYPETFQRWFDRFMQMNDLPHIGLHGLRHTHASMLAYMSTDKAQISERLGHSKLSTTLNIYTHLFEDTDAKIAQDLSSQYFGSK